MTLDRKNQKFLPFSGFEGFGSFWVILGPFQDDLRPRRCLKGGVFIDHPRKDQNLGWIWKKRQNFWVKKTKNFVDFSWGPSFWRFFGIFRTTLVFGISGSVEFRGRIFRKPLLRTLNVFPPLRKKCAFGGFFEGFLGFSKKVVLRKCSRTVANKNI